MSDGEPRPPTDEHDVLANRRAFTVMVRNEAFRLLTLLARKRPRDLPIDDPDLLDSITGALDELWDEYDEILLDADARSPARFLYDHDAGTVTQIIHDPDGIDEWRLVAVVDAERSREEGKAILTIGGLVRA